MKTITQQQMDNLIEVRDVMWPSVPKENVIGGLHTWRDRSQFGKAADCNTIACFGGWCAVYPKFMEQGVFANAGGAPKSANVKYNDVDVFLFGHCGLFSVNYTSRNDHKEVTRRINKAIKNSVVA